MTVRYILFLAVFIIVSQGCGVVKRGTIPWKQKQASSDLKDDSGTEPAVAASLSNGSSAEVKDIKKSLERAYNDWKGVPYVLGSKGYSGVDCSSFMQIVFEDYFYMDLPRNTREQFKVGSKVNKRDIHTGDLVFFKTGAKTLHVGVMVNEVEFLHASTSTGVRISNLQNNYWKKVYYTARRIL
ncbi:MAG: hypothetical protein FH748_04045 [Balneolaceae bacterium]|nr:hypothetical protein [Balneolaceae bacterium]